MSAKRTQGYRERVLNRAGEPILDIPDISILAFRDPATLIADFQQVWGVSPRAVVLPIASADGVNFDNPCALPVSRACDPRLGMEGRSVNFGDSVNAFA